MIAKKSDLILKSFAVFDSQITFNISSESNIENTNDFLNSFPVDIDFDIEYNSAHKIYRIFVTVDINADMQVNHSGYSIGVSGVGFFEFDETSQLNEQQKFQMLQTSALSICITNLRSYIANQTSYFPWGSFSFHAIDIQDLLNAKAKSLSESDK